MYVYIYRLTMLTIYGLTSDIPFVDGYTSPSLLVEALSKKIPLIVDSSSQDLMLNSKQYPMTPMTSMISPWNALVSYPDCGLNPAFTAILARWISMIHPFLLGWYGAKTYSYIFLQPFGIWGCFHHWTFSAFGRGFSTRTLWPKAVALGPVMHLRSGWNKYPVIFKQLSTISDDVWQIWTKKRFSPKIWGCLLQNIRHLEILRFEHQPSRMILMASPAVSRWYAHGRASSDTAVATWRNTLSWWCCWWKNLQRCRTRPGTPVTNGWWRISGMMGCMMGIKVVQTLKTRGTGRSNS